MWVISFRVISFCRLTLYFDGIWSAFNLCFTSRLIGKDIAQYRSFLFRCDEIHYVKRRRTWENWQTTICNVLIHSVILMYFKFVCSLH
ncbi:Uncharacterized protein APZ42_027062 [Daphnia magna]|uniref:Uncharacterized protein n=1 Tax=Daphnia magna TaxID=35525 RepID=A0A164RQA7_9CRUS|nr:Uncharacterized protein APZ42_027062 [Daphnia magna]